jgi:hypothetical protein
MPRQAHPRCVDNVARGESHFPVYLQGVVSVLDQNDSRIDVVDSREVI